MGRPGQARAGKGRQRPNNEAARAPDISDADEQENSVHRLSNGALIATRLSVRSHGNRSSKEKPDWDNYTYV